MTDAQPAGEHHVGTLDLSGEGNRAEDRLPNNISPEAVEAAAKAHIEQCGWDWNDLDQGDLDHDATKAVLLADMRVALRAAYPAIREQVAEEIAVAIEGALMGLLSGLQARSAAAAIARRIGGRDLDPTAPGQAVGADLTAGANTDPSDPPESQALSKRLPGVEG